MKRGKYSFREKHYDAMIETCAHGITLSSSTASWRTIKKRIEERSHTLFDLIEIYNIRIFQGAFSYRRANDSYLNWYDWYGKDGIHTRIIKYLERENHVILSYVPISIEKQIKRT